jgi:hypothetical protein
LEIKAKVEKIWSLCYEKEKMPYSKLIAKKFTSGIIAKKLGKVVS